MFKKIFRFFWFVKRQEKQELQEDNISQRLMCQTLLGKSKRQVELETEYSLIQEQIAYSSSHKILFPFVGFVGTVSRNRRFL